MSKQSNRSKVLTSKFVRHTFLVAAAAACMPVLGKAQVIIDQVEASSDASLEVYTPVNFGAATTVVGTGTYAGVTMTRLDATGTGYSDHAAIVSTNIFGTSSPGRPYISTAYIDSVDRFYGSVLKTIAAPGIGLAPLNFPTGTRVTNHSYVLGYGSANTDTDAMRRLNSMTYRQDVVMVTGLTSSFSDSVSGLVYQLPYAAFNAIAVRGDSGQIGSLFTPVASPIGKNHADVWVNDLSSFACGAVTSMAAGLIGNASALSSTNGQRNEVVRSLLMSGANRTVAPTNFTYTIDTANNLSGKGGAGQASYSTSLDTLQAGERTLSTVTGGLNTGSVVSGTPSLIPKGFAYGTVNANATSALTFSVPAGTSSLSVALNWSTFSKLYIAASQNVIDTTTANTTFANLNLYLRPLTLVGGQWQLGAAIAGTGLTSTATGDNVETLYSTQNLPAGQYALVVTGDTAVATAFGLSYRVATNAAAQWNINASGSWSPNGNWTGGVPNAIGAAANFTSAILAPRTVTLATPQTVGYLTFNNSNSYTLTGSTLTLQTVSGDATVAVTTGTHTIASPVNAASPITKSGPGTLVLSGGYTGAGGLTVSAGTVVLSGGGQLASLAIANDGAALGARTYSAVVDIGLGSFVVSGGASPATTFANLNDMARAGQSGVTLFSGNGLTSSVAAADAANLLRYAVGVIPNNYAGSQLYTTFGGYTVGFDDVLVKLTYFGDADLNGIVDDTDFFLINNGYGSGMSGWINGDFDYSGTIDDTDFFLINNGYGAQGPGLRDGGSVPEPTAAGAIVAGLATVLARRRR